MTFPQTIRSVRESLNLTQAEFAHKLGISSQTVNNWETGRVEPWPRKKQHLLESLGMLGKGAAPSTFAATQCTAPLASRRGEPSTSRPNVCREIQGEALPVGQVFTTIEVRKPPPHV
jgi:transcriptional regulator with XRE-family HTH domain